MANIFNKDFQDFINALNNNRVDYILLGGYAVILHGYSRTTGDLDIWVKRTKENYQKLVATFREFRMPLFDMTEDNFLNNDSFDVFSFGVPPVSIDLMTKARALNFDEASKRAQQHEVDGIMVNVVHVNDLIHQKKIVNRAKDRDDVDHLSKRKP